MKELLLKALEEQKQIKEECMKKVADEIIRIKTENINNKVDDKLKEDYVKNAEHISYFARAILFEQRTSELPKGLTKELLQDEKWLFDYAKEIDDRFKRECGL